MLNFVQVKNNTTDVNNANFTSVLTEVNLILLFTNITNAINTTHSPKYFDFPENNPKSIMNIAMLRFCFVCLENR